MDVNTTVLKAYLNHFLPREVVGPVIIVFSLEGVIDGIFSLYVPGEYATAGWGVVFVLSIVLVAYWGSVDEPALEELQERIDEIEADVDDAEMGDRDVAGEGVDDAETGDRDVSGEVVDDVDDN